MFAIFVLLFAANFLAAENYVIPDIVDDSITIQTTTSTNIVGDVLSDTMSMGSSMQSTIENVEMNISGIDTPLENMVEEIVEESQLDIVEGVAGMGSGIESISENMELLSENIEEAISSPMHSLESSLMTGNISGMGSSLNGNISGMGSSLSSTMGSEIIGETIAENIREMESTIPYSMNTSMQNLPSTTTLSELEMMSDIEGMYPSGPLSSMTSQMGGNYISPLMESSSMTSQMGGNYISPLMESIPGMENLPPNMPYLSNIGPSSLTTSRIGGNYISPLMESIPGMENLPPNMPYLPNMSPSSLTTSLTGGNYISPLTESISGLGNMRPNMPYPSMTGLTSPLTSMQQLESQIGQVSPTMPYLENMSPHMPPGMPLSPMSSMQEWESELDYAYPGPMPPGMGNIPTTSYSSGTGLLSPLTSTIKQMESEIEESSIPLMNLINASPLAPPTMGPVLSLPSLGSTLEELEDVTTSNIPLIGSTLGGGSLPMRPNVPQMPPMEALINVPTVGSAISQLEHGINSVTSPLMETMPIIGNSIPLLQPSMGGYPNVLNKENIQPLGPLSPGTTGYMSGSRIPLMNNMMSPFQNLPFMNRMSPLMSNISNMQQSKSPGQPIPNGLLSPLRQAMSNLKTASGLLQPSMSMMGSNSMLSNIGLSELTSLIDQDSLLPSSQKSQFLNQMSSLGPSSLGMIQNMYRMMGNSWQSRLHRKIENVRQARRELFTAIECFMSGDEQAMRQHIMAAISALGQSPITTALQYAMNQDSSSLSLMANMSRLILDRVQ